MRFKVGGMFLNQTIDISNVGKLLRHLEIMCYRIVFAVIKCWLLVVIFLLFDSWFSANYQVIVIYLQVFDNILANIVPVQNIIIVILIETTSNGS